MSTVTAIPLRPVKRGYLIWLWLGLAAALAGAFLLARQGEAALLREARGDGVVVTSSGLRYKVLDAGQAGGPRPTDADVALVNYEGRLADGTTFDKSQQPTPMPVTGVVPGFSEALKLMPKAAKYRFWLPPELGYGAKGAGPIPPNATLVFDVELIDFLPAAVLQRQMMDGTGVQQPDPNVGR
jgi:FKBP-type peptidyl-prolyl cis-trans isomerase